MPLLTLSTLDAGAASGMTTQTAVAIAVGAAALLGFVVWVFWRGRDVPRYAPPPAARPAPKKPEPAKPVAEQPRRRREESAPRALLDIQDVTREYRDADGATVKAVNRASLRVEEGDMIGIIGPSGQGKSTLLNVAGGLDVPTRGQVHFAGRRLPSEEGEELRRFRAEEVSFVFQDLNLVTHLTALENAALPLLCRGSKRAEALAEARANLERVGIAELAHRRPSQLSGGQKQRVAIARAFTSPARLILADEPTGSLDPKTARDVMDAFHELSRAQGRTVVLVTHNTSLARRYCTRILRCTSDGLLELKRGAELDEDEAAAGSAEPLRGEGSPA